MSKNINNTLPTEIVIGIIQNLREKPSIKTCLSVCKFWRAIAQAIYELKISVDENSLERLSKDMKLFATRVKGITLKSSYTPPPQDISHTWFDMISSCPNLTDIRIDTTERASEYIRPGMRTITNELVDSHQNLFDIDIIWFIEAVPHLKDLRVTGLYEIKIDSRIPSTDPRLERRYLIMNGQNECKIIDMHYSSLKKAKEVEHISILGIKIRRVSVEELLSY